MFKYDLQSAELSELLIIQKTDPAVTWARV